MEINYIVLILNFQVIRIRVFHGDRRKQSSDNRDKQNKKNSLVIL